jgi:hypothetical protein
MAQRKPKIQALKNGTRILVTQDGYIKKWRSNSTDYGTIIESEKSKGLNWYKLKMDCGSVPFNRFTDSELRELTDEEKINHPQPIENTLK